ncbi:hypothetical protein B566_EDAN007561 [Ephemera danica]|nr:hypothetical protein B566_EDAN007561 [Ephemera danica]
MHRSEAKIMRVILALLLVSMLVCMMGRDAAGVPVYGELESAQNTQESVEDLKPLERKKRILPIFLLLAAAGGSAAAAHELG